MNSESIEKFRPDLMATVEINPDEAGVITELWKYENGSRHMFDDKEEYEEIKNMMDDLMRCEASIDSSLVDFKYAATGGMATHLVCWFKDGSGWWMVMLRIKE